MDPDLMATIDAERFDSGGYDPDDDWDTSYYDSDGVYHWQCETCGEWEGNCFGPWDEE